MVIAPPGTARAPSPRLRPGISLMQEFIGLAYFAEIPAVIFDIQRGSPSTGMPTRTQQADIISCAYARTATQARPLVPQDRTSPSALVPTRSTSGPPADPVFVMLDLDIGMNDWLVRHSNGPGAAIRSRQGDDLRGSRSRQAIRSLLDVDGDGIAYRTLPGTHPTRGAFFTRARPRTSGRYTEEAALRRQHAALMRKFETASAWCAPGQVRGREPTRIGAIYFGSSSLAMEEALGSLEGLGIHLDTLRSGPFRSTTRCSISSPAMSGSLSSSRTATRRCAPC